jgi:hypothetical protein
MAATLDPRRTLTAAPAILTSSQRYILQKQLLLQQHFKVNSLSKTQETATCCFNGTNLDLHDNMCKIKGHFCGLQCYSLNKFSLVTHQEMQASVYTFNTHTLADAHKQQSFIISETKTGRNTRNDFN